MAIWVTYAAGHLNMAPRQADICLSDLEMPKTADDIRVIKERINDHLIAARQLPLTKGERDPTAFIVILWMHPIDAL